MSDHGMTIWSLEPRFAFEATPINITGTTADWSVVMVGAAFDYSDDTQANVKQLDLVGDANNPLFYTAFDDKGTTTEDDDEIGFRIRIGDDKNGSFTAVALVGVDADLDGDIDLFLSADGKNGTPDRRWPTRSRDRILSRLDRSRGSKPARHSIDPGRSQG